MKEMKDGLFGFVTLEASGNSNIKSNTQFIDEIETDAPVPFNIPIEFNGEAEYGEHDVVITVRYKDSVRDEIFLPYETTIVVNEISEVEENSFDPTMIAIPILVIIGIVIFVIRRRKKQE